MGSLAVPAPTHRPTQSPAASCRPGTRPCSRAAIVPTSPGNPPEHARWRAQEPRATSHSSASRLRTMRARQRWSAARRPGRATPAAPRQVPDREPAAPPSRPGKDVNAMGFRGYRQCWTAARPRPIDTAASWHRPAYAPSAGAATHHAEPSTGNRGARRRRRPVPAGPRSGPRGPRSPSARYRGRLSANRSRTAGTDRWGFSWTSNTSGRRAGPSVRSSSNAYL
ncbi:Uncharacterised protein [Mycobacteroides abscessus subsp. abscessus]|nr:Uncharacterised protein [Mycobacteroides abscessus subsp. abscessus]